MNLFKIFIVIFLCALTACAPPINNFESQDGIRMLVLERDKNMFRYYFEQERREVNRSRHEVSILKFDNRIMQDGIRYEKYIKRQAIKKLEKRIAVLEIEISGKNLPQEVRLRLQKEKDELVLIKNLLETDRELIVAVLEEGNPTTEGEDEGEDEGEEKRTEGRPPIIQLVPRGSGDEAAAPPVVNPSVDESSVDAPPVVNPSIDESSVDAPPAADPSIDESSVDAPPAADPSIDESSVDAPPAADPSNVEESATE